jgi:iron complex outermembrane receptor protein
MEGQGLTLKRRNTLGETLSDLPGMSSTGYGPAASRPVIRGLDADRIRILQNGSGMLDASSLSFDHAVALDPMMMDRVEVVRGAAALLYGGSAVGGVVNVIDNRIPQDPVEGVQGRVEMRFGGAERERGGGLSVDAGNGRIMFHADAYTRRSGDLDIRGPAVSGRLRALSNAGQRDVPQASLDAHGRLPNSASQSDGGAVGASVVSDKGLLGLSYSEFGTSYGAVAEPGVTIDMKSNRWDFAGELRDAGPFSALKFRHGRTDYEHKELDAGVVGTTFLNKGSESRLEAVHRALGPFTGSVGLQLNNSDFSALGAEAFIPETQTDARAVFLYEEMPVSVAAGKLKLNFGGRLEKTEVSSAGGGNIPTGQVTPRFGAAQTRNFSGTSTGVGALYTLPSSLLTQSTALAVNLSSTQRAPTFTELYANGPHAATGSYEVGDANFDRERSRSLDIALRLRSGAHSGSIGVFHTRFRNFITEFTTGATRGADGEVAPVDAGDGTSLASGEEILPEVAFRAVPAVFRGIEAQGLFRLSERAGTWDLELRADYVRAHNADTGAPLPRIAPLRFGGGLLYARDRVSARFDVTRTQGQSRVSANELPTDGYTMVNAYAGYRFKSMSAEWEAFVRANNLLNVEARNHVSFIKDIAPMPGRGVTVGLRSSF